MNAAESHVNSDARRIYVQLAPDARGREVLLAVQSELPIPRWGRMVSADELHMTVIHFGKANDVFASIGHVANIDRPRYDESLQELIDGLEKLIEGSRGRKFTLTPTVFDGLGKNGHTLVIRYQAPEGLYDVHARALAMLKEFFSDCGVDDVDQFMADDPNFQYATTLTPHITLYKGYDGPLPQLSLSPIDVELMKIVY